VVEDGSVVVRGEPETVVDYDSLDGAVEQNGENGVFEAANHDALVDELIFRPAQAAQLLRVREPACRRGRGDDEQLEGRSARLARLQPRRQTHAGAAIRRIVGRLPLRALRTLRVR